MPSFTNSNPGNMPNEAPVDEIRNIEMTQEQEAALSDAIARVRRIIHITVESQAADEVKLHILRKCTLINDIFDEILEADRRDFFEAEEPRYNALIQDLQDDFRMNII
ncbi:hypothetical protein L3Y34_013500 [Caenorhabditis briggsae]|uniref:Uncharacterized protein n=1 Tax=Caenorhabditis briggsae TaxID=6238 RepID=A0AAE8ZX42_CAEBR|nr:hypothetical protein L3Y34_013500 [Caenorhabditis briggsae]